ncbi:hypothetical protein BpHYR1_036371 [Brachionus plicatilis]|uniref:Uncharacterized protein n=1 Tax=Brachionus plicatilis TaxID=10195 RepID=A0A3M7P6J3_BRAPC|nr:hypothetical protein BpHYR1_036371 [Brachionus plicatilis]
MCLFLIKGNAKLKNLSASKKLSYLNGTKLNLKKNFVITVTHNPFKLDHLNLESNIVGLNQKYCGMNIFYFKSKKKQKNNFKNPNLRFKNFTYIILIAVANNEMDRCFKKLKNYQRLANKSNSKFYVTVDFITFIIYEANENKSLKQIISKNSIGLIIGLLAALFAYVVNGKSIMKDIKGRTSIDVLYSNEEDSDLIEIDQAQQERKLKEAAFNCSLKMAVYLSNRSFYHK